MVSDFSTLVYLSVFVLILSHYYLCPVNSNGYLCAFNDLCITAVLLDDIMKDPERPRKEQ